MIIGVDVGVNTAFAIFHKRFLASVATTNTYKFLEFLRDECEKIQCVVMEDSREQTHIFNTRYGQNQRQKMYTAKSVGSVDGRCAVIQECCNALDIKLICISPKQKGRKYAKHSDFIKDFPQIKLNKNTTNEHERDAIMCVLSQRANLEFFPY